MVVIRNYHLEDARAKYVPSTYASINVVRSYYAVSELGKMFVAACVE